jgi:hypothetical protein
MSGRLVARDIGECGMILDKKARKCTECDWHVSITDGKYDHHYRRVNNDPREIVLDADYEICPGSGQDVSEDAT